MIGRPKRPLRNFWFVDPAAWRPFLLIISPGAIGVIHPECEYMADIALDLDSFYCTHCESNGRISGAWVLEKIGEGT